MEADEVDLQFSTLVKKLFLDFDAELPTAGPKISAKCIDMYRATNPSSVNDEKNECSHKLVENLQALYKVCQCPHEHEHEHEKNTRTQEKRMQDK